MGLFRLLLGFAFGGKPGHQEPDRRRPDADASADRAILQSPPIRWHAFRPPAAPVEPARAPAPRPASPDPVHTIRGRCHVIDGDTIVISGRHIRLAGIDAPELNHPYGRNAKWALVGLCKGRSIRAVLDGGDSYDRLVATCHLPDGRDLSEAMVRLGLALDWPRFSGGTYRRFEPADSRRILWRCDARQKGRMPPPVR